MEFFGDPGHAHRGLSHDSLPVQTALSGDHQVGVLHILPQPRFLQNDLDPGFQDCAGKVKKAKPSPPAAPVPGNSGSALGFHFPAISAKWASPRSMTWTMASSAPFWGP